MEYPIIFYGYRSTSTAVCRYGRGWGWGVLLTVPVFQRGPVRWCCVMCAVHRGAGVKKRFFLPCAFLKPGGKNSDITEPDNADMMRQAFYRYVSHTRDAVNNHAQSALSPAARPPPPPCHPSRRPRQSRACVSPAQELLLSTDTSGSCCC